MINSLTHWVKEEVDDNQHHSSRVIIAAYQVDSKAP